MSEAPHSEASTLAAFAAAVAHEIRTPLAAVAGEVELALRRERTTSEYREALQRIGEGIAELVEITTDLTLLSGDTQAGSMVMPIVALDAVLSKAEQRYLADDVDVAVGAAAGIRIPGDEARLARAFTLLLEHAVRHRRDRAAVRLRVEGTADRVRLLLEADAPGFWPRAWSTLGSDGDDPAMPLRLRTARRILQASGGTVRLPTAERNRVQIDVPRA